MPEVGDSSQGYIHPGRKTCEKKDGRVGGGKKEREEKGRGRASTDSLVPRPHPLTRRNGLVKQVEFLGLPYAFATV